MPILPRVFAHLGQPAAAATANKVKHKLPNLTSIFPERGSDADFLLCRAWLAVCDRGHKHADTYIAVLPTRIIDVGVDHNSNKIHLRVTNRESHGLYIALSHRWQKDTPTTTIANLDERRNSIELDSLPRSYQDAVRMTRRLGIRFLWIDSLCIVQNSHQDWDAEAGRMDRVFSSAYCTIAISPRREVGGSFEMDVEHGELSQRGWILQERALSRRTIHFTGDHIY